MSIKRTILSMFPRSIRNLARTLTLGRKPGDRTRRGVPVEEWRARQERDELKFWRERFPKKLDGEQPAAYYRRTYHETNAAPFRDLELGRIVVDVGCGPFGTLAYDEPIVGIEPLADAYMEQFGPYPDGWRVHGCMAEEIPLEDASVDTVVCVNALDHMQDPWKAVDEIVRILKSGGRLVLSTDVGGTPGHPCLIEEADLDDALLHRFDVIQHECSADLSSTWPADLQVPLFVFQGLKRE